MAKTASELAARGVKIFRAGIWKPRTKPGGFEGIIDTFFEKEEYPPAVGMVCAGSYSFAE